MTDITRNRIRRMKTPTRLIALGAMLVAGTMAFAMWATPWADPSSEGFAQPRFTRGGTARDLSEAFKQASREIKPTVVNIRSIKRRAGGQRPAAPSDPLGGLFGEEFRRFFEDMFPEAPFEQEGMGSGVIVSADGYLLTNYHVVRGADELEVRLSDSRTFKAKVVGTDDKTDLAVLKIDAKNLPAARFGNSDALEVGDWVIAVGNPFGFDHTVTAGIVSAKGRSAVGIVDYEDFIQTDAAINPGNSGGPLVNLDGEVVGINTAIVSRVGAFNGIGLSIPSKMARQIMESIRNDGRVIRGWMGVGIQDLNGDLAASFGYPKTEGVLVSQVSPGGPAAKAGMKEGDIIVAFDGETMKDAAQLRNTVAATTPGESVSVRVFRSGRERTLTVTVTEREAEATEVTESEGTSGLGIVVETLTPAAAKQLGYAQSTTGVLIRQVEPGSVAARAGLGANEVIVAVGEKTVQNVGEFQSALRNSDMEKGIRLKVLAPEGFQRFVFLKSR